MFTDTNYQILTDTDTKKVVRTALFLPFFGPLYGNFGAVYDHFLGNIFQGGGQDLLCEVFLIKILTNSWPLFSHKDQLIYGHFWLFIGHFMAIFFVGGGGITKK